jgi:hypothetical protein
LDLSKSLAFTSNLCAFYYVRLKEAKNLFYSSKNIWP